MIGEGDCGSIGGMKIGRGNRSTCSSATLSTTNRLSYGAATTRIYRGYAHIHSKTYNLDNQKRCNKPTDRVPQNCLYKLHDNIAGNMQHNAYQHVSVELCTWPNKTSSLKILNINFMVMFSCPMLGGSLSPRHGASSGCGWRRRPPVFEGSCEYIE
jgi:hypothetical protein